MSIVETPTTTPTPQQVHPERVQTRKFTADEVLRMVEAGILAEDDHVELIDGELIEVTPQGPEHAGSQVRDLRILMELYKAVGHVRPAAPLDLGPNHQPQPDLVVVRGGDEQFLRRHPGPGDVLLAVELSRTSQALDRQKAVTYARAGIPVYWLIDLVARRIEVHTKPGPEGYAHILILAENEDIALPEIDQVRKVKDFLP